MDYENLASAASRTRPNADDMARDWPHQVVVPSYLCTGKRFYEQRQFCERLSLCPHIDAVRINDTLFRVFRFSERRHAQAFERKFAGFRYLAVAAPAVTMIPVIGFVR